MTMAGAPTTTPCVRPVVKTADYPSGEHDIVSALPEGMGFSDLVAIVQMTGDTLFAYSDETINELFRCRTVAPHHRWTPD